MADIVRQAVEQFLRIRLEDDVAWQSDTTALIESGRVSSDIDPGEIGRDIERVRQDVRSARR